jgi:hypothetical protein
MSYAKPALESQWIPPGREGTYLTLLAMKALARRDALTEAVRLFSAMFTGPIEFDDYIRAHWVIVADPPDVEYVRAPSFQLEAAGTIGHFEGDCDDAATLAASVMWSLSWPCSLIAIRSPHALEFEHVFLRCAIAGGGFFDVDPIVPRERLPIVNVAESLEVPVYGIPGS